MSDGGRAPGDSPRWRRIRLLGWLTVVVVIALGVGGLVASLDHPAGDLTRPELTARRDNAAAPVITAASGVVAELTTQVEALREIARDALVHTSGGDHAALTADIARGSQALDGIAITAGRVSSDLATLPTGPERTRLSDINQSRIERLEQVAASVGPLRDAWAQLAVGAVPAIELIKLLQDHDSRTLEATEAAAASDYTGALDRMTTAASLLARAETLRATIEATGHDVSTLTVWLLRARDRDDALTGMYAILQRNGGVVDAQAQAARTRAERALAALPIDVPALIVIVADVARADTTSALIAIDESRGALAEATDALDGAPVP